MTRPCSTQQRRVCRRTRSAVLASNVTSTVSTTGERTSRRALRRRATLHDRHDARRTLAVQKGAAKRATRYERSRCPEYLVRGGALVPYLVRSTAGRENYPSPDVAPSEELHIANDDPDKTQIFRSLVADYRRISSRDRPGAAANIFPAYTFDNRLSC